MSDDLIIFDGAGMAVAADVDSNFAKVKARADALGKQFAQNPDTTAALVFGYFGGNFRNDNAITVIADGTVTLTDDDTNYVEVDASGVTANAVGFTSGKTPLYVIVTAGGAITSVEDKRAWAFLSNSPGDMLKSTYDTDNDGIVDAAETAPWSGISGKPSTFAPSAHAASHGDGGADEIAIDGSQVTTGTIDKDRLPVMGGATSIAAGTSGMAPAPAAGDDAKVLFGDGTYKTPPGADGTVSSVNTRVGDVTLDSSDVGLANVTNDAQLKAADLDTDSTMAANSDTKIPSQKAVKTALAGKLDTATTQAANRVLAGPSTGSAAAPTFRALAKADLPALAVDDLSDVTISTPSSGQVLTYDGSDWVNDDASGGVALGETSTTAYRGDRGKIAYDHSQLTTGNPHNVSLTDLSLTATATELNYVDGVTSAIQTQLNAKAALSGPTFTGVPKAPTAAAGTNTTQLATTAFVFAERAASVSLTNKNLTSGTNTFPTFNQNTTGNAATATKLATARTINGVAFDGSADITISAGSSAPTVDVTAAEALTAGQIINIKSDGTAQLADATNDTKPAIGFVDAAYASSATAKVLSGGIITGLSGLTPGATQYLATTAGGITETAPDTAGQIVQILGTALSSTSMIFNPSEIFLL